MIASLALIGLSSAILANRPGADRGRCVGVFLDPIPGEPGSRLPRRRLLRLDRAPELMPMGTSLRPIETCAGSAKPNALDIFALQSHP